MKILLLGGGGFIGRNLLNIMRDFDVAVLASSRCSNAATKVFQGRQDDLPKLRDDLASWGPEVVIDLVSENAEGVKATLAGLHGIASRFVVASSLSVYQNYGLFLRTETSSRGVHDEPLSEDDPVRNRQYVYRDQDGASTDPERPKLAHYEKIAVEQAYRSVADTPVDVLRLPLVFGPGDPSRSVQSYAEKLRRNPIIFTPAQAGWRQSRCYVIDVAKAFAAAALQPDRHPGFEIYNVSDGLNLTEADWVTAIAQAAQARHGVEIDHAHDATARLTNDFPIDADYRHNLTASNQRIMENLGWSAGQNLNQALRATIGEDCV